MYCANYVFFKNNILVNTVSAKAYRELWEHFSSLSIAT